MTPPDQRPTVERISIAELRAMTPQELDQRLDGAIARYERVMRRVLSEAAPSTPDDSQRVKTLDGSAAASVIDSGSRVA